MHEVLGSMPSRSVYVSVCSHADQRFGYRICHAVSKLFSNVEDWQCAHSVIHMHRPMILKGKFHVPIPKSVPSV